MNRPAIETNELALTSSLFIIFFFMFLTGHNYWPSSYVVVMGILITSLDTVGAPGIWIDQSEDSRQEKLYRLILTVKCMLSENP